MIYLVKVTIEPKDPNEPNVKFKYTKVEGVFVPDPEKQRVTKQIIEDKCKAFLLEHLKKDNPELTFTFLRFDIQRYKNQFTLNDNQKQSSRAE